MKKLLLTTGAVAALSMVGAPAFADSFTFWDFAKGKFTEINEITQIEKTVNIYVTDTVELDSSADALVAVNSNVSHDVVTFATVDQLTAGNSGGFTTGAVSGLPLVGSGVLFHGDQANFGINRSNTITGSVNHDTGIGQLNQDSGNNSNQGNVISAAFVFDSPTNTPGNVPPVEAGGNPTVLPGDVAKAEAYVEQIDSDNAAYEVESKPNPTLIPNIQASIDNSIDNDTGVFMVNQNAGNNNSQHNALAAAVGDNTFTALSDAGLHQVNEGNFSFDIGTVKTDSITASANHDTGLVMVNQSVGNMNNQATVVSVATIASFVGLGP